MRRVLWLLCLSLGAVAWAATPWKILPGASVGTVTLGGDSLAVAKSLGVSASHPLTNGLMYFQSDAAGLNVQYEKKEGKIVMVTVLKAQGVVAGQAVDFAGDGGVTIGSSVAQMEAAYGRDYEARDLKTKITASAMYYAYKRRGIGFLFKGNTVSEISVWPKH